MSDLAVSVHESIADVDRNQWNNVVEQSSTGSVFHRHGWLQAVERGLDRRPKHAVVTKGGNPVAVFPNFVAPLDLPSGSVVAERLPLESLPDSLRDRAVSLGDVDFGENAAGDAGDRFHRLVSVSPGYGGPVVLTDEAECLALLFRALSTSVGSSVLYHRIGAKDHRFVRYGKFLAKRGYRPTLLDCRFELDLESDFDDLVGRMDKERRKALRDARSRDFRVRELPLDEETVPATYDRYETDIDRVGGDAFPRSFFEALATCLPSRTTVFAVEVDGDEVGRYVYLLDDEQSSLHYYISAIGDEANFAANPSELLHAHAIEWGQERGYRTYDFGSTGADFRDGLFRFKEKFGGRSRPIMRWEKGYSPVLWRAYRFARRRYQREAY